MVGPAVTCHVPGALTTRCVLPSSKTIESTSRMAMSHVTCPPVQWLAEAWLA